MTTNSITQTANSLFPVLGSTSPSTTPTGSSGSTGSNGSTGSTGTGSATAPTASQTVAGNYDTFLQLLTTQLQNQDPLSPLDTTQFTQQLVEFASVEQQINMNTNLQTLISMQQTSEATSALQLIGSTVTVNSTTAALSNATNSPASWTLSASAPGTANITISSSTGQVAYTGTMAVNSGTQSFTWNGQSNGITWPDGSYTIAVTATGANGQAVIVTPQVQGTVTGVNISQNPPTATINGQNIPINQIQSISGNVLSSLTNLSSSLNSSIANLNSSLGGSITNLNNSISSLSKLL